MNPLIRQQIVDAADDDVTLDGQVSGDHNEV